jgi:hypothetical protein
MRLSKFAIPIFIVLSVGVTVAALWGLYRRENMALFLATLGTLGLLVLIFAVVFRGYQRLLRETRVVKERIAELRFLQERRYEQVRWRLDELLNGRAGPGTGKSLNLSSELEDLKSRVQLSERRILGRLENELWANDQRDRQIAELRKLNKDAD